MKIKVEKISNDDSKNIEYSILDSENLIKILKESSYVKNREIDEIVVLNKYILNNDNVLFEKICKSHTFNEVSELILIDDFYYFDKNNQFIKLQKHKFLNNIKFKGKCYLHSIWISDNGFTLLGIFEKTEIDGHEINNDTVNINFDLGVVNIFGYISYESFVDGYKFAMNNYNILKNENCEGFDLFHENITKTIDKMKQKYYKNV